MTKNKQITGSSGDPREDALNSLFADSGDETLTITDLPSQGKFYPGFQGVEISPLTFLDEQKILSLKDSKTDIVSKLLEKSVKGVEIDELLSMDKMFLLMKVREVSYGDNYEFRVVCPACDTEINTSLPLSNHLNMTQVPDDLEDPREITLPRLKVKAEVRFPRSREETFLRDAEETYKNMYRFVISINGNSDPVFIAKALKRMHIQDVKTIISEINKGEYGVNPRFIFECPECGHNETMAVPMDVSFFSVS
tara:strand:- start:1423 stop:2178 length:756 start_codon:yes stop_codon:yes gene_type:complete